MQSLPGSVLALWAICSLLSCVSYAADGADKRTLTIADAIQTTRAMTDADGRSVFFSPDGRRYAMMLIRGEVDSNRLRADIVSGVVSREAATAPHVVARFYTSGLGPSTGFALYGATALTMPSANPLVWLDNSRVAFLWEDAEGVIQVVSVDVVTRSTAFVTASATNVLGFATANNGALVYDASIVPSKDPSNEMIRSGFAVASVDALPMLAGYVDGTSMFDFMNCDRYVLGVGELHARKIDGAGNFHCGSGSFLGFRPASSSPLFSRDGSRFIINAAVATVPSDWSKYTNMGLTAWLKQHALNPKALAARLVQQLLVVDVRSGTSRPLWNAPYNSSEEVSIAWSPDARSLALAPTFAPVAIADAAALEGRGAFEVEVATGKGLPIPIAAEFSDSIARIEFPESDIIRMTARDGTRLTYRKTLGSWHLAKRLPIADSLPVPSKKRAAHGSLSVELRQDMSSPPVLYSVDSRSGMQAKLLDLNPQLNDVALGKVEVMRWTDEDKREWQGRLYYPAHYDKGRRYPLVIQARCSAAPKEFSLYGCGGQYPTLGPGWSVFLGQVLAGHDIAVLQLAGPNGGVAQSAAGSAKPASDEALIQTVLEKGWRAAAEHLIEIGLADKNAVGILGYSLTGWVTEYVLSRSHFRYAAAIASDHGNMGYLQAAISGWPVGPSNAAGAEPFGAGLQEWVRNTPAFNVETVHTPLQLHLTSSSEGFGNFLWQWEMFSRLRYLRKPVEYYVIPDVQHGSHTLQNPRQLMVLQTRAVEWWCFWLKGQEIGGSDKEAQYRAWRELRRLHEADREAAMSALGRTNRDIAN